MKEILESNARLCVEIAKASMKNADLSIEISGAVREKATANGTNKKGDE